VVEHLWTDRDFISDYENLFAALLQANSTNSVADLRAAQPLFWDYLSIAEKHGIDTSLLHSAYLKLITLINHPNDESISLYGDVIIPVGKLQFRYEQEFSDIVEETKKYAVRLSKHELIDNKTSEKNISWPVIDKLFQDKKIPDFIAWEIKDHALDYVFQMHLFEFLHAEIMHYIFAYLKTNEIAKITQTCRRYHSYGLFQITLMEKGRLLDLALKADPDRAEKYLNSLKAISPHDWWRCILKKAPGVEPCGRRWKSISALEFLTFNGDFCFRRLLLNAIPQEGYVQALEQIVNVKEKGLEGHKRHLPIRALSNQYQDFYDNFELIIAADYNQCFGEFQNAATLFVLQLLCDQDFISNNDELLIRPPFRELWIDGKPFYFDSRSNKLGQTFYIRPSEQGAKAVYSSAPDKEHMGIMSLILTKLCNRDDELLSREIGFLKKGIAKQNQVKPKKM